MILNPIDWRLCRESTIESLIASLKTGVFEELEAVDTRAIIARLGRGEIGTSEQSIIERSILLATRPSFEIKVFWRGDKDPEGSFELDLQQLYSYRLCDEERDLELEDFNQKSGTFMQRDA